MHKYTLYCGREEMGLFKYKTNIQSIIDMEHAIILFNEKLTSQSTWSLQINEEQH